MKKIGHKIEERNYFISKISFSVFFLLVLKMTSNKNCKSPKEKAISAGTTAKPKKKVLG